MENFHEACEDCVLNGNCLFQSNNDIETCGDVVEWDYKKITKENNNE